MSKFNHFIDILQQQYAIIGEQNQHHRPSDEIVAEL